MKNLKFRCNQYGLNLFYTIQINDLPNQIFNKLQNENEDILNFKSLILIGNYGKEFWNNFKFELDKKENPVDNFCIEFIKMNYPQDFDFYNERILYPNPKFVPPLQLLGRFLKLGYFSPLGIDISKDFGLWFSYRLLILSKQSLETTFHTEVQNLSSPCYDCKTNECLQSCPASATSLDGLSLKKCLDYRMEINSSCLDNCHSRISCPLKKEYQFGFEQINYHMKF